MTGESGGLLVRLRMEGPTMPEALAKIAEAILDDPETAAHASIVDLAERSGTSTATVTRFSRALGFKGYANLRVAVATETGRAEQARWETDISGDIAPEDPIGGVLDVITAADTRAIQATASGLDTTAVERVAAAIATAGRVEIFGLGSSGTAGSEMAFRLERIRVPVRYRADTHTALTNAALLGPGDVAISLSHSGRTREAIEMLAEAADHGALTVAVTSYARSPLAEVADVVFTTSVHETTFRLAALSALHSQLLILDLIYVAVAQRTYERTTEALELTVRAVDAHRMPDTNANRKRARKERPL
ncbi:MurR/RpiR family transcriptional regulator [Micromonospora noduli]|uniref:HTH-type transcriptional regulat or n=1 Tax=Micromonospora noduli TaxID=709876 RepID=A0A328NBT5_9ACTN|nr:MurR/RpiR family transcriptional regulator [Micromonospora noduli]KAB1926867.1 MurR/RpiR family transcriptional regulator [Micromonospora noduli]RAO04343.1 putative HTH-type transcriptional regulat or [Micromonospora noduli]RAO08062.1 putative HTH-type transcriptional regulat or [Micromonospora noduli]RAO11345.1 putative HTH-type transcriptional regulat or [Micromonospora noduli]RAO25182.1 putative HTH-type transcriptional regulat or [Micromonospora noduli]